MATAHLLHGYLGSGKTTLARRLERENNAVRFTPDEWMARLFGEDPPAEIFQEKVSTVLQLLEPLWIRCLALGVDVVLDYGFWRRSERDHTRQVAEGLGAKAVLYHLRCDDQEARSRVERRNGAGAGLYIAPATFEVLRDRFEPLDADEDRVET
jgi:predicted kinase